MIIFLFHDQNMDIMTVFDKKKSKINGKFYILFI